MHTSGILTEHQATIKLKLSNATSNSNSVIEISIQSITDQPPVTYDHSVVTLRHPHSRSKQGAIINYGHEPPCGLIDNACLDHSYNLKKKNLCT